MSGPPKETPKDQVERPKLAYETKKRHWSGNFFEGWIAIGDGKSRWYVHPEDFMTYKGCIDRYGDRKIKPEVYEELKQMPGASYDQYKITCRICKRPHFMEDCPRFADRIASDPTYRRIQECPLCGSGSSHWGLDCPWYIESRCSDCLGPHWAVNCPVKEIPRLLCPLCRKTSHEEENCRRYREGQCPFCGDFHRAEDCPQACGTRCDICGGPHITGTCPNFREFFFK